MKSDEEHPVRASSLPAFSTDLHKHHVTAHRETHLKPKEEKEMTLDQVDRPWAGPSGVAGMTETIPEDTGRRGQAKENVGLTWGA